MDIGYNPLGEAGVQAISTMRSLTSLDIGNALLGDAWVQAISKMSNLKFLKIKRRLGKLDRVDPETFEEMKKRFGTIIRTY